MEPQQIQGLLLCAGYTYKRLAEELGNSTALISLVVNRRTVSARVMRRIAEIIKHPPAEVFPDRAYLFEREAS